MVVAQAVSGPFDIFWDTQIWLNRTIFSVDQNLWEMTMQSPVPTEKASAYKCKLSIIAWVEPIINWFEW